MSKMQQEILDDLWTLGFEYLVLFMEVDELDWLSARAHLRRCLKETTRDEMSYTVYVDACILVDKYYQPTNQPTKQG